MDSTIAQTRVEETDGQVLHIKGVIESLLFVNERPITSDQIRKVLDTVNDAEIKEAVLSLQGEYEERKCGMKIVEIAGGYQMLSNPTYASYLRSFYKTKHKEKLSKPALESMAIIAYKQPVTRSDIELIRGVNSDGVVSHLLNKELIKVIGRKDVPGRPYVYGTTKQFLEYFGLKSIDDLPTLEEKFPALAPSDEAILPEEESEGEKEIESETQASQDTEDIEETTENVEATETEQQESTDEPEKSTE